MDQKDPTFLLMENLSADIAYHANLYFNKDRSEISDYEYDEMVKRYEELALAYPAYAECFSVQLKPVPLVNVRNEGLSIVKFDMPMLSLSKQLTLEEFNTRFKDKFKDDKLVYELKLDGLALEVRYKDWKLDSIYTRGDGLEGEDVTHSLPVFEFLQEDIPKHFPSDLIVRGEAIVSFERFRLYNETAAKKMETPRNAVSGWIRRLAKNQKKETFGLVNFCVYWTNDSLGCKSYSELTEKLLNGGFYTPPKATFSVIEENIVSKDWPTDGVVVKIDDFDRQKELGVNNKYPRWATAYKYPPQEGVTPFERVFWNTGKTGRVVPTVHYAPIKIGGVTCTKASLDNYYQFMSLGLRNGAVLNITRNGDVIPRINRIMEPGTGKPLKAPTQCPSCAELLEIRVGKESTDLICNNVASCQAQLLNRCVDFVDKKTIDIRDLGPVKLAALIEDNRITRTSDILLKLDKHSVGTKVYYNIIQSKKQPLWRVIKALGLPKIGVGHAKKLAQHKPQCVGLLSFLSDAKELMKVPGISGGIALPISAFLEVPENVFNVCNLLEWFTVEEDATQQTFNLKGCITGTLGNTREEVTELFEKNDIELIDRVTKDCVFLVVGEKPSRSKVLKATELNILTVSISNEIKSVEDLIDHIKGRLTA